MPNKFEDWPFLAEDVDLLVFLSLDISIQPHRSVYGESDSLVLLWYVASRFFVVVAKRVFEAAR